MGSRSPMWLARLLAVLAGLSLLVTACSNDDSTGDDDETDQSDQTDEALDEDDYIDEFDEICADDLGDDAEEFEEDAQSVGQDPEEGAGLINDFLEEYGDALDELRALPAPEDLEEDLDDLFSDMEEFGEQFEDLADAVEDEDDDEAQTIITDATELSLDIQEQLEDLELDCGEVFARMSGSGDSGDFSDASDFSDFSDASDDSSLDFSDFSN